jgi:hypothetical protein
MVDMVQNLRRLQPILEALRCCLGRRGKQCTDAVGVFLFVCGLVMDCPARNPLLPAKCERVNLMGYTVSFIFEPLAPLVT